MLKIGDLSEERKEEEKKNLMQGRTGGASRLQRPTSGGVSRRSTTWPFLRCDSTISSISLSSTYVYHVPSGYTTATGAPAQRSRQPALFTRTWPTPARPAAFTRALQWSNAAWAPWLAQQSSPLVRWLRQKKMCRAQYGVAEGVVMVRFQAVPPAPWVVPAKSAIHRTR